MNEGLPNSLDRFAAQLEQAMRRELGSRCQRRLVRLVRARARLLAGGTLGADATGAALAVVIGVAGSSPAFAITRNRDGIYSVTLRSVSAIPAANRELSRMGLHAQIFRAAVRCPARQPPQAAGAAPPQTRIPVPTPVPLNARIPTQPVAASPERGQAAAATPVEIPVCGH